MQKPVNIKLGQLLTVVGLAVVLVPGLDTQAQTRAGNDGHALDANQQVGSNGVNPADGRLDFSRQNDIVTGRVSGGRAFQGDIGYFGVGEFQGNLGSDALFNFQRDSISSSPSYLNATAVGGFRTQDNFRVFRSFTNRSAQPQSPGLVAPSGGTYEVGNYANFGTIYSGQVRTDAFRDSINRFAPGRAQQVFPTTGIRAAPDENDLTSDAVSEQLNSQAHEAGQSSMVNELSESLRVTGNTFDPFAAPADTNEQTMGLQAGQLPQGLLLGQQLQDMYDPQAKQADPYRGQAVLNTVFKRIEGKDADADDADVYDKLLSDIKKGEKGDSGSQGFSDALEAPTSQQLTEAERAYDQIMKELYGEDYQSRGSQSDEETDGEVKDVVEKLNYDLPRLETLASNKRTRVAELTREAEAALANGKYLTAETRYRQLMREAKGDPLPIAGLVHAQLGAGMFRSAGVNLRNLFAKHPELIATRYDAKLLPPKDRLQWIQQELQTVISQGEGGKDAPLLLAYLGYQADSRQVVRFGLALAQSKSPRDPLLLVVREIWLDESDTPSSDGD